MITWGHNSIWMNFVDTAACPRKNQPLSTLNWPLVANRAFINLYVDIAYTLLLFSPSVPSARQSPLQRDGVRHRFDKECKVMNGICKCKRSLRVAYAVRWGIEKYIKIQVEIDVYGRIQKELEKYIQTSVSSFIQPVSHAVIHSFIR